METTELVRYRRALKRKNYSAHTVKNYVNIIDHFMRWLTVPLPEVTRKEIGVYVDHLLRKRRTPKTITCHLQTIRLFFDYLMNEEGIPMVNPVTRISLRLPKPLPRHLKDDQVTRLFAVITDRERQGHVHVDAPLRPSGRRGCSAHRGCGRVSEETDFCLQRKRREGQGRLHERRCPLRSFGVPRETIIESERIVPSAEGTDEGETAIGPRHPEEDRILCAKERAERLVSSASPHHGHAASQRRCGPCYHPGPPGAWPDYHDPALLPGSEPQGPTRLLQGHGGGLAKDAGTEKRRTTKGRAWILHGDAEEEVLMRTKHVSADKETACAVRGENAGLYKVQLMRLFKRGHGMRMVST